MDNEEKNELLAALTESMALMTVMQAQVHSLIATHPARGDLMLAYRQRMERHLSNGLASALKDAVLVRLEHHHQAALKEMSEAGACGA